MINGSVILMGKKVKFEKAKSTIEGKKKGTPCKMLIIHIPSWQSKENNSPRPEASVLGQEAKLGYCYREGVQWNSFLPQSTPHHLVCKDRMKRGVLRIGPCLTKNFNYSYTIFSLSVHGILQSCRRSTCNPTLLRVCYLPTIQKSTWEL